MALPLRELGSTQPFELALERATSLSRRRESATLRVGARALLVMAVLLASCDLVDEGRPSSVEKIPDGTGPWVRSEGVMQDDCQRAADELAFPVPCPTVVPGDFDREELIELARVWGEGFHFEAPLPGHLAPSGSREEAVHVLVRAGTERRTYCDESEYAKKGVRGWEITLHDCPQTGGIHANHVLAQWEHNGVWHEVSSHVDDGREFHEDVVVHIIRGLDIVEPDG